MITLVLTLLILGVLFTFWLNFCYKFKTVELWTEKNILLAGIEQVVS